MVVSIGDAVGGLEGPAKKHAKFEYLEKDWRTFIADFDKISRSLVEEQLLKPTQGRGLLDTAFHHPTAEQFSSLPVFSVSFNVKIFRAVADAYAKRMKTKIMYASQTDVISKDCDKFREDLIHYLDSVSAPIVVLEDMQYPHQHQSVILRLLSAFRHTYKSLVVIVNYRQCPVDDYTFESEDNHQLDITYTPRKRNVNEGKRVLDDCYVLNRKIYRIDKKDFATRVLDRLLRVPAFTITPETADWIYQMALWADIDEMRYILKATVFHHADSRQVLGIASSQNGKAGKAKAKKIDANLITGISDKDMPKEKLNFAKWSKEFPECKKKVLDNMKRLEQIFFRMENGPHFKRYDSYEAFFQENPGGVKPYEIKVKILEAAMLGKMPTLDNTRKEEEDSKQKTMKAMKAMKAVKTAEEKEAQWYEDFIKTSRFKMFADFLKETEVFFRIHCVEQTAEDARSGIFNKLAETNSKSQVGSVARLYRWLECNGRSVVMPEREGREGGKQVGTYAQPDFVLKHAKQATAVISEKCMSLVSGSKALVEKEHFGRVLVANPNRSPTIEKDWRVDPNPGPSPDRGHAENNKRPNVYFYRDKVLNTEPIDLESSDSPLRKKRRDNNDDEARSSQDPPNGITPPAKPRPSSPFQGFTPSRSSVGSPQSQRFLTPDRNRPILMLTGSPELSRSTGSQEILPMSPPAPSGTSPYITPPQSSAHRVINRTPNSQNSAQTPVHVVVSRGDEPMTREPTNRRRRSGAYNILANVHY